MSAKTGKRPIRSLSAHEKLDAIKRVHDGESKASVARDIGVPESTLRGWCKNENKISYLSRQSSSPDTDDQPSLIASSGEPKEKRLKLDPEAVQPFNLSLKCNTGGQIYTPSTEARYNPLDYTKTDPKTPENLSLRTDTPKASAQMTEREKNRAELARLSIELGLNRPEMFATTLNSTAAATNQGLSEFAANLHLLGLNQHQWANGNGLLNLMMQQQLLQTATNNGHHKKSPSAPADSSGASSNKNHSSPVAKPPKEQQSVEEYIKCWLRAHDVLAASSGAGAVSSTNGLGTLANTNMTATSASQQNGAASNVCQSSWFWKWYKELTSSAAAAAAPVSNHHQSHEKAILYQQLTKDENVSTPVIMSDKPTANKPINSSKGRSVLDNLLLINNINNNMTNNNRKEDKSEALSQNEALEHGEKFMKWLETCSDPLVTAVQIMQFRTLLNNVKSGADRRRNGAQPHNKTKGKRK